MADYEFLFKAICFSIGMGIGILLVYFYESRRIKQASKTSELEAIHKDIDKIKSEIYWLKENSKIEIDKEDWAENRASINLKYAFLNLLERLNLEVKITEPVAEKIILSEKGHNQ
jgi:hypothetical protein